MTSDGDVRVVLVDDDALVRAGLRLIFGGSCGVEVVGEAEDGSEVPAVVASARPHVVLMDLRMPGVDGLEATRRLLASPTPPKVLVLTTMDTDDHVARALAEGASGFLLKDTPPADIVDAVHRVARGEPILSPSVTASLIRRLTAEDDGGRSESARALIERLTEREREVALAIGEGKSNAEIAGELYMSVATVKAHVTRVLDKLEATNRVQVAIRVHDAGLL